MFITNQKGVKTLKDRLVRLIGGSREVNFLVGFFFFSGWREMIEAIRQNQNLRLKILVGLEADYLSSRLVEFASAEGISQEELSHRFGHSLRKVLNNPMFDTKEFEEDFRFFMKLLQDGRLEIKKTLDPNHAKLYLFKLNENRFDLEGVFITGSSNLTRPGLEEQNEFNIEVRDYGYEEAQKYFNDLWESAVELEPKLIESIVKQTIWSEVRPFDAYMYVLKNYLDSMQITDHSGSIRSLLAGAGFKEFSYQIDAVNQGLKIIEDFGGVIIADVVGLGKSVVASLIANRLNVDRGLIIVPPGLIGDPVSETGWHFYTKKFQITHWDVISVGEIRNLIENDPGTFEKYEAVIVDEAHRFRNEDTSSYEALQQITQGKKVILLTATPFNNSPGDIFSLLKLFIVPGQSALSYSDDLQMIFRHFKSIFRKASHILRYGIMNKNIKFDSKDEEKRRRALRYFQELTGEEKDHLDEKDLNKIRQLVKEISTHIKEIISPVVIRRNRLDLLNDPVYKKEITDLPKVRDPEEIFFELTKDQLAFYSKIVEEFFGPDGQFKGAVYRPFHYEKKRKKEKEGEENREELFQTNLFDFMRRLLVKRFESSFGAFRDSVERFMAFYKVVLKFIKDTDIYFLDRDLIESAYDDEEALGGEKLDKIIEKFRERNKPSQRPRNTKIYKVKDFELKKEFLEDIESDIKLFRQILEEMKGLQLVEKDPKRKAVIEKIKRVLEKEPDRKVVIFTEYADTVKYLQPHFEQAFNQRVLFCDGNLPRGLSNKIEKNFNAQVEVDKRKNDYDILLTTDKLSEGVNLNRAGAIVNYDIPWNPTRVIQRVGRINRIGQKVFDELYIYNLFPTEIGANINQSREIAAHKMFMIHNALGEDVKIFDVNEEPSASKLYEKINRNPDEWEEDISLITQIRSLWEENLKKVEDKRQYIQKLEALPSRIKSSKYFDEPGLVMVKRKGVSIYAFYRNYEQEEATKPEELSFEALVEKIKCDLDEKLALRTPEFWKHYKFLENYKWEQRSNPDPFMQDALKGLKELFKKLPKGDPLLDFVLELQKDLKEYKTLPRYTLRKFKISKDQSLEQVKKNVEELRKRLGDHYLKNIERKIKDIHEEVLIAIENRKA